MTSQAWLIFVAIIGALLTVLNIVDKVIVLFKKAKQPQEEIQEQIKGLSDRIDDIEQLIEDHKKYFDNDKKRIDLLETNIRKITVIIVKSLQALTEHALDGNNLDQLKSCADEMNDYLINK
jgi:predicted PurR-regulated permease PerM